MRFIDPVEFGLLGMVVVFSGFLNVLSNFGLGSSLIQKQETTAVDNDTIFWSTLGLSVFLALLLAAAAPWIAAFYEEPRLQLITVTISSLFLIQGLGATHTTLAKKQLDFRSIFYSNVGGVLVGGGLAVYLAFQGFGVWALVVQQLVTKTMQVLVIWIVIRYRPRAYWSKSILRDHLRFSLPLVGRNSLNYWSRNADNFFIGKFLGAGQLGLYTRAYSLMMMPVSKISGVISSVLFPSLSLIQDDEERIVSIFLKVTRIIAFITFPLMASLYLGAESFIQLVLGERWLDMKVVLQILCSVGALQSVATLNGNIFLVKDKTLIAFYLNIFNSIVYLIGFYIGSQHSIERLSMIYLFSNCLLLAVGWRVMTTILSVSLGQLFKNIGYQVVAYVLILLSGIWLLSQLDVAPIIELPLAIGYACICWVGGLWLLQPRLVKEFIGVAKDFARR